MTRLYVIRSMVTPKPYGWTHAGYDLVEAVSEEAAIRQWRANPPALQQFDLDIMEVPALTGEPHTTSLSYSNGLWEWDLGYD